MNTSLIIKTQPNRRFVTKQNRWTITDALIPWIRDNVSNMPEYDSVCPSDVPSVEEINGFAAIPVPDSVRGLIPSEFGTVYCTFRLAANKKKAASHYNRLGQYEPKINIVGLN